MAKMYLKKECKFINGRIVHKNRVIAVPKVVTNLLDLVEFKMQESLYLLKQPKFQEAPSLNGFVRQRECKLPFIEMPETPLNDKQVETSLKIMEEIDKVNKVDQVNSVILELKPLFNWVSSEYVVDTEDKCNLIDTPTLGNPLELTEEKLVEAIQLICKASDHAIPGDE